MPAQQADTQEGIPEQVLPRPVHGASKLDDSRFLRDEQRDPLVFQQCSRKQPGRTPGAWSNEIGRAQCTEYA